MSPKRTYEGDPIDATYQYITERPILDEDPDKAAEEVVYATPAVDEGDCTFTATSVRTVDNETEDGSDTDDEAARLRETTAGTVQSSFAGFGAGHGGQRRLGAWNGSEGDDI
jgi:hypothetical protein